MAGLAAAVPGFADSAAWRGQRVQLHRKAVELAADLAARFGGEDPRFAFADAADLPADSGAHRLKLSKPMPAWVRIAAVKLPALPLCRQDESFQCRGLRFHVWTCLLTRACAALDPSPVSTS